MRGNIMIKGKPFVKWAGGKRQIIDKLKKYVPEEFNTYYEPFIGEVLFFLNFLRGELLLMILMRNL